MKIVLPEFCLVVLVGPSGCGKSTFARRHFKATEVLSSDFFRGMVSDDEANQAASKDAFEVLHLVTARRLAALHLTVIDATNVQAEGRKELLALARRSHCPPVAIVFHLAEELCNAGNRQRPGRTVGPEVVRSHHQQLLQTLPRLAPEGFRQVHVLSTRAEIDALVIERQPSPCNLRHEHGPFDIIGDVHGCFEELVALLRQLGYEVAEPPGSAGHAVRPPEGRKAVFVGDLVDRGPKVPAVLRLVMGMVESGTALVVQGNHDSKLVRKLKGNNVQVTHGLAASLAQLEPEPAEFRERVRQFLDGLASHYVFDRGRLVVAHAGMRQDLQGRVSARVSAFGLYGQTTGKVDACGLPERLDWAADYRGRALVVYGHTPVAEAVWVNRTLNLDTGCVFGGRLTALRYPEMELVSVPALGCYAQAARPFLPSTGGAAENPEPAEPESCGVPADPECGNRIGAAEPG
jgi:protein phosphatase